ncbi:hypothetical protein TrRE_jg3599 [Triparma retinervis]|uniref:EGF domain-specific O-linked N-acetylglucosamine transferase n=1 Tax=Triparma retinervis TaxID=2557542 RepID=A0A9W7FX17_9STRA|nr:hypothetical protein TrRE_jg3599 [Triparma retinervis]
MDMVTLQESVIGDLTREVEKMREKGADEDFGKVAISELADARKTIKDMEEMLNRQSSESALRSQSHPQPPPPPVPVESSCDLKYGRGLLDSWFSSPKVVCDGGSSREGRPVGGGRTAPGTTYLLHRDEDSENAFHSTADFINMHMVYEGLGVDRADVVLFDRMPDGPFKEMIDKAYSEGGRSRRKEDFGGEKVTFKRLVFHLESPAGIIFPKIGVVGGKKQLVCRDSYLWHGYRERVLRAFDLWDVPPPRVPTITMVVRKRTPSKNVGRIMSNEDSISAVIAECSFCVHRVLDLATLSYREQLSAVRGTNVLVGVHGAGLMNAVFLAEEAVLIEVHPHYRMDRHFRIASRMTGKIYMPMRTKKRVTCQGSSDNVEVDEEEFRNVLDGAIRLARR